MRSPRRASAGIVRSPALNEVHVQQHQPPGVPPLELTGERTLPDVPEENYWFRRHLAVYEWIRARVGGLRVADLACGEGYGSDILAQNENIGIVCQLEGEAARQRGDEVTARQRIAEAERFLQESLRMQIDRQNKPGEALSRSQLSQVYLLMGALEKAEAHAHQARPDDRPATAR